MLLLTILFVIYPKQVRSVHETIHKSLSATNPYQWAAFEDAAHELEMTSASGGAIYPCNVLEGQYILRVAGNKRKYLSKSGNRLRIKFRFTTEDQDTWTVLHQTESHKVSPFIIKSKLESEFAVGAHKKQSVSCAMAPTGSIWKVFPSMVKQIDAYQKFVAWCGYDGRKYLQVLGSNQWIQQSGATTNLVYKETFRPETAFEFISVLYVTPEMMAESPQ